MHLSSLVASLLVPLVAGHANHDYEKEMAERREFLLHSRGNLDHCASKIAEAGIQKRAAHRRAGLATKLGKRSIEGRDLEELLGVSHHSDEEYTVDTDPSVLFSGNNSCVLSPEATEGPFYVAGEYVRKNIVDDESGVPLTLDIQVLDVDTCEPVEGAYLEIWHCNSTGVYSGVVSGMNGNGLADPTNLNNTFHRGFQQTDTDGAAQFETLFPGHYSGRAIHIHVMVHLDAEARENNTVLSLTAAHAGQMYFDQDLISQVELEAPYSANTQPITLNADDFILAGEAATADPFMEYVLIGDTLAEGLLAWLSFGINTTFERTVSAAANLYEEGGEANEGGMFGGGGGCFPAGGAIPTGTDGVPAFPSGFPTDFAGGFPGGVPTACPTPEDPVTEEPTPEEPVPEEPATEEPAPEDPVDDDEDEDEEGNN